MEDEEVKVEVKVKVKVKVKGWMSSEQKEAVAGAAVLCQPLERPRWPALLHEARRERRDESRWRRNNEAVRMAASICMKHGLGSDHDVDTHRWMQW
jgi:hypothetical protein